MRKSTVNISLRDENGLACSYAIVDKGEKSVIIILFGTECAIYDADDLQESACCRYLLLKHYHSETQAYRDFLKLIGKMCAKKSNSKYFGMHIDEDNRMVVYENEDERMYIKNQDDCFNERFDKFRDFLSENQRVFFLE